MIILYGRRWWKSEARGVLFRLEAKAEMVRHDRYPRERYLLVGGSVEGE